MYKFLKGRPVICSECSTGKWHGQYDKRPAEGMLVDQNGFLWSQKEVDEKYPPTTLQNS